MRSAKSIAVFCATAAFAMAAAIAPPAFATNNQQSGAVVQQSDLEQNGWYCMQSSETPYYYVCTKVFGQTYECYFGICSPSAIRPAANRVSRLPSNTVTATASQTTSNGATAASTGVRAQR